MSCSYHLKYFHNHNRNHYHHHKHEYHNHITFSITMELRTGEAAVDKLKARFEVQARGDGEVFTT